MQNNHAINTDYRASWLVTVLTSSKETHFVAATDSKFYTRISSKHHC